MVLAARKCTFNGRKYSAGQTVVAAVEACAVIRCQARQKKGRSTRQVELALLPLPLSSCTCAITSRASKDSRNLQLPTASRGAFRHTLLSRHKLNSVYHHRQYKLNWKKRRRLNRKRARSRKKKKCVYNKQKYGAGTLVVKLSERCLYLVCRKTSVGSEVALQFISNCVCSDKADPGHVNGACKYAKITPEHSMCKQKNTTCGIKHRGVTEAEKTKILQAHNHYRAKVAWGKEERGNPGPQPPAANMKELIWSDELAQVAQAWSNTCPSDHDCHECRQLLTQDYYIGQNLYWSWGFNDSEEWNFAISAFYNEVVDVPNSLVNKYQSLDLPRPIGHYTQLVWAETQEVGCGAVYNGPCSFGILSYNSCKTYVCNYGPAGNFLGHSMYKVGPAASQCPGGVSLTYSGLCK
ncbi:CRISP/Allergen/PR-1 isoform X2 [Procambarus clarkii]